MRGPLGLVRWVRGRWVSGLCGPHSGKRKRGRKVNEDFFGRLVNQTCSESERFRGVGPGLAALRVAG